MQLQRPSLNSENFKKPTTNQTQVYVETETVSLQDVSRRPQKIYIQKVQRNQGVEMARIVNYPSLCSQRSPQMPCGHDTQQQIPERCNLREDRGNPTDTFC